MGTTERILEENRNYFKYFLNASYLKFKSFSLKTGDARTFIQLDFSKIETECSFDYVFVYDGDTYNSTKLASVSGDTLPKSLVAKSGRVSLERLNYCNFNDRITKLVKSSYSSMSYLIGVPPPLKKNAMRKKKVYCSQNI